MLWFNVCGLVDDREIASKTQVRTFWSICVDLGLGFRCICAPILYSVFGFIILNCHFVLEYVGEHDLLVGLVVQSPLPLRNPAVEFAAQLIILGGDLLIGGSLLKEEDEVRVH